MHFLNDKPLPRRTFVRGLGATVALPFLDAMLPARLGTLSRQRVRAVVDHPRLVAIEMVVQKYAAMGVFSEA